MTDAASKALPAVSALHEKALDAARTKAGDKTRVEQLTKGSLGSSMDLSVKASAGDVDGDAGLANYVSKAKNKKKETTYRGLSNQDVENETDRSKRAVAAHMARAEAALNTLRKGLDFTATYDDDQYRVTEELRSLSLEQYLHRSRQRFHAQKNKVNFQSNLDTAERKHLFETDVDTMDPRDAHQPLPPTEEEIEQLGRELGLLKPAGGWKSRCDCEKKLEHIKHHVKMHERKLTKIKMLTAFFNQLDSVMLAVDDYRNDIARIEEERLREVLEAKQNHFSLMATVQNQKQQLDRLKRRVKDVNEMKAMEEEDKEAERQLSTMKEYLMNQTRNLGNGGALPGGGRGGGPGKHIVKQRLRRVMQFSANNEKRIMGSLDFDGHEDKQMLAFLELQRAKSSAKTVQVQTMSDAEYFDVFGVYPTGNIGFVKRQQAVYSVNVGQSATQSAIAPAAIAEMRRLAAPTPAPSFGDSDAVWSSDTRLVEAAVQQLAQQVAAAFEAVESQRSRVQTTVVQLCKDNEAMMEELNPLYAHVANAIKDASKKLSSDVKLTLKRIGLAANDAVNRSATDSVKAARGSWVASAGQQPTSPTAGAPASKQSFADYVAATERAKATGGEKPAAPPKAGGKKSSGAKSPEATAAKSPPPPAASAGGAAKKAAKTASAKPVKASGQSAVSPPPALERNDDDDRPAAPSRLMDIEIPMMLASHSVISIDPAAPDGPDLTSYVPKDAFDATVSQMAAEYAQRLQHIKDAVVRIAHRLSQCEVLDFGQGKVVDLELAQTPAEMTDRIVELASHVDDVVKGRDAFVPSKVIDAFTKLHKSCCNVVTALKGGGFHLPASALEYFAVPLTLGERVTGGVLCKDVSTWEGHFLTTASRTKELLGKMCDADRRSLEDRCADVVDSLQQFASHANQSIAHVLNSVSPGKEVACEREMPLEAQSNDLPLVTRGDIESSVQRVATALAGQTAFFDGFSDAVASELLDLQEQNEDLRETAASLKARLLLYEPEKAEEGDDPWAGMTTFERQVVEDRDRLRSEVDQHKNQLRDLEQSARDQQAQQQSLRSELDLTRREIHAASEEHKAALQARHAELVRRMLEATEAEEVLTRATIEEALHVAFVPLATAFASAFVKRPVKEPNPDAETQTALVACGDFECDTADLALPLLDAPAQTDGPALSDGVTAMTVPPSPMSRSVGMSRRISFVEASTLTMSNSTPPPPPRTASGDFTSAAMTTLKAAPPSPPPPLVAREVSTADEGVQVSLLTDAPAQPLESVGPNREDKSLDAPLAPPLAHTAVGTSPSLSSVHNTADGAHSSVVAGDHSTSHAHAAAHATKTTTVERASSPVLTHRHSPPPPVREERGTTPTPLPATVSVHTAMSSRPTPDALKPPRTPVVEMRQHNHNHRGSIHEELTDASVQTDPVIFRDDDDEDDADDNLGEPVPSSATVPSESSGAGPTVLVVEKKGRAPLAKRPVLDQASRPDGVEAGTIQPSSAAVEMTSVGTWAWPDAMSVWCQTEPQDRHAVVAAAVQAATTVVDATCSPATTLRGGASRGEGDGQRRASLVNGGSSTSNPAASSSSSRLGSALAVATAGVGADRIPTSSSHGEAAAATATVAPDLGARVPQAILAAMDPIVLQLTRHAPSAHGADLVTLHDLARYLTEEVAPVLRIVDRRYAPSSQPQREDSSSGASSALPSRGPVPSDSALRSASGSRKSKRVTIDAADPVEQRRASFTTTTPAHTDTDAMASDTGAVGANAGAQPPLPPQGPTPAAAGLTQDRRRQTPLDEAAQLASRLQGNFERLVTPADTLHRVGSEFPTPHKHPQATVPTKQHSSTAGTQNIAVTAAQHRGHGAEPAMLPNSDDYKVLPLLQPEVTGALPALVKPTAATKDQPSSQTSAPSLAPLKKSLQPASMDSSPFVSQSSHKTVTAAEHLHSPLPQLRDDTELNSSEHHPPSGAKSTSSLLLLSPLAAATASPVGQPFTPVSMPVELVDRPVLASASRSLRPNSRGLVDVERLLEVHLLLVQTLTELFKRLETKSKVVFEDPFESAVEPPQATAVISNMHLCLSSVFRLLHTDSRLARRSLTRALMQHAMNEKLTRFRKQRGEMIALAPQAAAFLDRQEEKMRIAVAKLDAVKQQISMERERMVKEFFLPVSDVPVAHIAAGLLPRRKTLMPPPTVGTVAKGSAFVAAAIQHNRSNANDSPPPPPTFVSPHLGRARTPQQEVPHRDKSPTKGAPERPAVSKTPMPDLDPRWMVRPAPRGDKVVLGSLRPPAARRIVESTTVRAAFQPDRELFTSPLQGRGATLSRRAD